HPRVKVRRREALPVGADLRQDAPRGRVGKDRALQAEEVDAAARALRLDQPGRAFQPDVAAGGLGADARAELADLDLPACCLGDDGARGAAQHDISTRGLRPPLALGLAATD